MVIATGTFLFRFDTITSYKLLRSLLLYTVLCSYGIKFNCEAKDSLLSVSLDWIML